VSTLPPLFHELVDDAALFPPGNAAMADAVPAHNRHRSAWYSAMVGPFLCPASRLPELADAATAPLRVGVIIDTGAGGIDEAVRAALDTLTFELRGVEVPLRGEPLADSARRVTLALDRARLDVEDRMDIDDPDDDLDPDDVHMFVEVPLTAGWRPALDWIAVAGHRAKLRTGGPIPDAFPAERSVAEFILACLEYDVPFKLTAGLHRAVRNTTADGFEQHGFLNALLAVADALDGADAPTIARTLADRDDDRVAARVRDLPPGTAITVRTWLMSFGSCSIDEPLEDLVNLGLISKE
jgi:hypothetical protein